MTVRAPEQLEAAGNRGNVKKNNGTLKKDFCHHGCIQLPRPLPTLSPSLAQQDTAGTASKGR